MHRYPEMQKIAWRIMLTGAWPTLETDRLDPVTFQAVDRLALAQETYNVLAYREKIRGT